MIHHANVASAHQQPAYITSRIASSSHGHPYPFTTTTDRLLRSGLPNFRGRSVLTRRKLLPGLYETTREARQLSAPRSADPSRSSSWVPARSSAGRVIRRSLSRRRPPSCRANDSNTGELRTRQSHVPALMWRSTGCTTASGASPPKPRLIRPELAAESFQSSQSQRWPPGASRSHQASSAHDFGWRG